MLLTSCFKPFKFLFCWKKKDDDEDENYFKNFKEISLPMNMVYFDYISPQEFPLPKPIINYLLKNANVENIKKLQKTCRYFYSKFHYIIIDDLRIFNTRKNSAFSRDIAECSKYDLLIVDFQIKLLKNNLYLNKKLFICGDKLEHFYPKIVKYDICELTIFCCKNFTINEFEFLTNSRNLEIVIINNDIYYPNKSIVPVEDILSYIPNVYFFSCSPCTVTSKSMTKILLLKRNVKFRFLHLFVEKESELFLDVNLFYNYIKEMFEFADEPCYDRQISLYGNENAIEQLHELFKLWREKCYLSYDKRDLIVL